jgi:hypothetical protein
VFTKSDFASADDVEAALLTVGELLQEEGERFAIVVIGGAALQLLGIISRSTGDVDMIAFADAPTREEGRLVRPPRPLPAALDRAIRAVSRDRNLPENWLNSGPAGQWNVPFPLPPGFESRLTWRSFAALDVGVPGHLDFVCFKLEAAADQPTSNSRHFKDLEALSPSSDELHIAAGWVKQNNADTGDYHAIVDRVIALVLRDHRR